MCVNSKIVKQVIDLVNLHPNDMVLGEEVRKLFVIELNLTKYETTKGSCDCVCGKEQTK